jgi:hypothetical protein
MTATTDSVQWDPQTGINERGTKRKSLSLYYYYYSFAVDRLTKDHAEAKKRMDDSSVEADKKTFLKAQIPKMEAEIKDIKEKLVNLLESDELDPRGEFYLLAQKLTK